jgi:digeranylgeranylglycerophospholipid reductase
MEKYDVVVVGAGTAGCLTAKTAAKAGLKVCLVDSKKREKIGEKVCGDAVGKHHFEELGLAVPKGEELRSRIQGIKIHSPDMQTAFEVKGEHLYGFILNRHLFGQRLLAEATDAGATLLDSAIVTEPLTQEGFVKGVAVKDLKTGKKFQQQGRVVVDASGFMAVLRKKLPPEIGVDLNMSNEDVEACYREIRALAKTDMNLEFCDIYLDQTVSPGGYYWIFPEGENRVNVGLGVSMTKGFPNPKERLYKEVLSKSMFKGSKILTGGAWYVPTRRPLDCMVGNGVVMVGDSACQVNPIHGGGIGASMIAGKIAGETIAEALEKNDVSRGGLWLYNVRYMWAYGAKQAGLDVFRLFLLKGVGNEELNYGMKYQLITQEDVLKASMGKNLSLNITEKTRRAFRGFGQLSMLMRLRVAAYLLKEMKTHYLNYPASPEGFQKWQKKTHDLVQEAHKRLTKKPR